MTADGVLVGTEQAADIKTFPKAAHEALKKATQGMKVVVTEIATTYAEADKNHETGTKAIKLDKPIIAYDADVEQDGKSGEFAVNAEGTILESPKWVKSADKKEGAVLDNARMCYGRVLVLSLQGGAQWMTVRSSGRLF